MKIFFSFLLLITLFSSCEKVIQIDLNTTDPRIVVEAGITDQAGPYIVKLSKSGNYFDANYFPPVTGAVVSFSDDLGNTEILVENAGGIYKTSTMQGVPGRTYFLKVISEGKEYTASSYMPQQVPVESVEFTKNRSPGNPGYFVSCFFVDPAGIVNYYRLKTSTNDTVNTIPADIRILSDKLTDGKENAFLQRARLVLTDSVEVQLWSINVQTYNYYKTLRNVTGEGSGFESSTPANPTNNISNGALGNFNAVSISTKIGVVH